MPLVYFNEGVVSNMDALSLTEYIAMNVMGVILALLVIGVFVLFMVAAYREVLERMGKHVHKPLILGQDKIFLGVLSGIGETFNLHSLVVRILVIVIGLWLFDIPLIALFYGVLYLIMKRNTDEFIEEFKDDLHDVNGWGFSRYCSVCGKRIDECECRDKEDPELEPELEPEIEPELEPDLDIEDLAKDEDGVKETEARVEHPYYASKRTNRNLSERIQKVKEQEDAGDKKQMPYSDEF